MIHLNAPYVLEALMGLPMRAASMRTDTERLLDTGFPTLAGYTFIRGRPRLVIRLSTATHAYSQPVPSSTPPVASLTPHPTLSTHQMQWDSTSAEEGAGPISNGRACGVGSRVCAGDVTHAARHPETALLASRIPSVHGASTVYNGRDLAMLVESSVEIGVGKRRGREMLLVSQPEIAEKMYGVVLNLCTHACTSDSVTRYLRTHEDFFARQLAALPPRVPEADDPRWRQSSHDRVEPVELPQGPRGALNGLLGVFFGNAEDDADADAGPRDWEDEVYGTSSAGRVGGQRSVRAVEMLQSLSFDCPAPSASTSTETALSLSTLGRSTFQSLVLSSSTRGPYDTTSALSSIRRSMAHGRVHAAVTTRGAGPLDERVLNVLNKHGVVQGFVYALKEADARLVGVLKPDPDDLNALYVFEAQMGLLMRAASTRIGAERLLDAGLLPTLAGCDFIDAQPEADHAFIDRDAFLPSAIQRYHQLLLPTLQLLTQLHSTLSPHQTCTAQTIRFLTSHADTLSILLKSPPSSLAALRAKARRAVQGGLNAAVGALAARALAGGVGESVGPTSDAEGADDAVLAPGYAQTSKFALAVRDAEHALERALLLYLAAASDPGEDAPGGITLVVAPVVGPARSTDSRVVATVPTMGDLFGALGALSSELHDTLRITHNLTAELSACSQLRIEDYLPILPPPMASLAASQSPSQTRSMIAEELGRIRKRVRRRAEGLVEAVEVALLVAWTHASVYAADDIDSSSIIALQRPKERAGVQPGSAALARAMAGAPKGEAFVRECARRAASALSRVDGLELGGEEGWEEREAFVGLMCVRVAEVLGLSRDTSGGEK
ncbi:unnamed protein product [Peniophora sp. CBMAI 1063]|nr:unnamed protein product [Peniophora sp. CBMAI 1063]